MLILGRWAGQGPLVAKASPELARTAARSCRELPVTHRGGGWPLSHCQNPWSHQGSTEVEGLGRGSQPTEPRRVAQWVAESCLGSNKR